MIAKTLLVLLTLFAVGCSTTGTQSQNNQSHSTTQKTPDVAKEDFDKVYSTFEIGPAF